MTPAELNQSPVQELDDLERAQLDILLEHYEAAQLRKAQAIAEAISRGLMAPPDLG